MVFTVYLILWVLSMVEAAEMPPLNKKGLNKWDSL